MSDAGAVADPSATTDGIGTWKLVLAILLPLLCIAIGACIFFYWRQRKQRTQKADIEQVGTMLQELKSSKAEVDAMRDSLHDGLERMKTIKNEADKRDSLWKKDSAHADGNPSQPNLHFPPALNSLRNVSSHDPLTPTPIGFRSFSPVEPRPLSGNTLPGTLPRAALGLQHTQYSRSRASSYQSAESGETAISYKPPSTIPEESTGNVSSSPFDTPGKTSTDHVVEPEQDESPSCRGERSLTRRVGMKARALMRRNSFLSPRPRLSPMRQNPSHPDLVPQPLAVTKRNSVRETSDESNNSLRARYGIDKTRLRRSASNPSANRSYLSDSDLASPTIPADKTNSTTLVEDATGILTPPPTVETMSVLQERRDGGNSSKKHGAKRNKPKKTKKRSHSSSEISEEDNKNKKATPKGVRNTPTPPPSGPPPPGSPPKRPLPVLPSRIPVVSNTLGPRKRSSLSSMRFSQSPSKRRSQFLLKASSFSSPIRGGRASTVSPPAITSPGKQRLPPSYASSQCLPSVETMGSLASASTSSPSSVEDSSSSAGSQGTKKTVSQAQQQTIRTFDNVTISRGGQSGQHGHARLLSELSATLRLVHEEEDAAAEQAVSTAASTRTTAAGVSS